MTAVVRNAWLIALAWSLLFCGCGEGDNLIRKKLEIVLDGDLKTITAGLPKNNLMDSVHYTIVSYKSYSEGMYSRMAVVDFYFLNNVKTKITRKYRYLISARLWDRYFNEYRFYGDSASKKTK